MITELACLLQLNFLLSGVETHDPLLPEPVARGTIDGLPRGSIDILLSGPSNELFCPGTIDIFAFRTAYARLRETPLFYFANSRPTLHAVLLAHKTKKS